MPRDKIVVTDVPPEYDGCRIVIEPGREYVVYNDCGTTLYTIQITGLGDDSAYGMTVPGDQVVSLESLPEMVTDGQLLPADHAS